MIGGAFRAIGGVISAHGEDAARRLLWSFTAAGLGVFAAGFATAAFVVLLTRYLPLDAALAAGATVMIAGAGICLWRAAARGAQSLAGAGASQPAVSPGAAVGVAAASAAGAAAMALAGSLERGDWKRALHLALVDDAEESPARAAALAALAGLILGALDGYNDPRTGKGGAA